MQKPEKESKIETSDNTFKIIFPNLNTHAEQAPGLNGPYFFMV